MIRMALDLFCGAGGATRGLQLAGFHVTGVDISPQPHYCGDKFIQADAFDVDRIESLRLFDLIWASPPCQGRTAYRRRPGHVRAVDTDGSIRRIRSALRGLAILPDAAPPYIIENVPGAPLESPLMLCGSMFGLEVRRHRLFETSFDAGPQPLCQHHMQRGDFPQATNRKNRRKTCEIGVWRIPLEVQRGAMQIDWMELEELSEAIPPAYARFMAERFLATTDRRFDIRGQASPLSDPSIRGMDARR
jgi:DNA (cytosine-5)-methyltransferase 1